MGGDKMKEIFEKAQGYKYNSVSYKDLEDIGEVTKENIFGMNNAAFIVEETSKGMQIHWGAESVENFIDGISGAIAYINDQNRENKRIFTEFIPPEFVEHMEGIGFKIVSEWVDFWVKDLQRVEVSPSSFEGVRQIKENEYEEASKVLRSCAGCSREFVGESEQWVKEWNEEENSCIFIAKVNNELVGVCFLGIYGFDSEDGAVLWLREIGVSPKYQGKGIGYALIEKAFQWGRENGAKRSFLACDAENCNGIKLYEKFGYRRKDERGQIDMAKY